MRRKITKEEQKILAKNADRIRTNIRDISPQLDFPLLAAASAVGGIMGAVIAFGILGKDHPLCEVSLFGVCIAVTLAIIGIVLQIRKAIYINMFFHVGVTEINGGVICYNPELNCIEYIEDDNVDENGAPYLFRLPEHRETMRPGERVLVLINGDNISIMRLNDALLPLVPGGMDGGWQAASDSQHIGHQKQLKSDDSSVTDADFRIKHFFDVYQNGPHYKKNGIIAAAVFSGFLGATLLIFAGYGFIFQYIPPIEKNYFAAGLPLIAFLTAASGIVTAHVYKSKLIKKYQGLNGVSKVILLGVQKHMVQDICCFTVVETDSSGNKVTNSYTVRGNYDVHDIARMQSGMIIYKYTFGNDGVFFGTK